MTSQMVYTSYVPVILWMVVHEYVNLLSQFHLQMWVEHIIHICSWLCPYFCRHDHRMIAQTSLYMCTSPSRGGVFLLRQYEHFWSRTTTGNPEKQNKLHVVFSFTIVTVRGHFGWTWAHHTLMENLLKNIPGNGLTNITRSLMRSEQTFPLLFLVNRRNRNRAPAQSQTAQYEHGIIIPPSLFPQSAESIYWKAWLQQFTGKKLGGTSITPHKLLGKLAVDTKGTVHWMYLSTKGKENLAGVHSMLTQADLAHVLSNVFVQRLLLKCSCPG